jgi:WS/DGAT/MGAT family acyltransferase
MRMSDTEAIMWAVEKDPALRSDFCNLTILDHLPDERRLQQTMDRALKSIPRLRQRVIAAPLRIVPPEYADDPMLDVNAHVRRVGVPQPADERALLDVCASISEQPLDRARPMWEFTLIDGLADGRAALLQKVHHTITDGEGGLRLSLAMVDFERDPAPTERTSEVVELHEPPIPRDTPLNVTRKAVTDAAARGAGAVKGVVRSAAGVVTSPRELPGLATDASRFVGSLRRQLLITDAARSDVMVDRSLGRRFDVYRLPLGQVRAAAASLGGSVNDVYVAGIASALGRYHERFGSDITELRMAMPISTRQRGDRESTNSFAPARVLVPIQPAHDVGALCKDLHDRLNALKSESSLSAASGLAGAVSGLPTSILVAFTHSQTRTIDFAASNLRGSPVPLYLAGARILANIPFGPRTGCAINVTMMSYCDELHLGINSDPSAVRDIDGLLDDIADAYDELFSYA